MIENYIVSYVTYAGFMIDIFFAEYIFALNYRRKEAFRKRFWGSLFLQIIVGFGIANILVQIPKFGIGAHVLEEGITYFLLVGISLVGLRFCYQENWKRLFLCVMTGYAVQHLQSQMVLIYTDIFITKQQRFYEALDNAKYVATYWIVSKCTMVVVYVLIYYVVARRANEAETERLENRNVLFFSMITIVMVLGLSCARDYYQDQSLSLTVITRLFSIMCCVFLLLIRGGFLEQSQLEGEVETIRQLNHKERAQFEQNRQNIELINVKCHDLKKRLEQYEDRIIGITPEEMTEMKEIISIYDTTVQTGNETLDTILTERSLICEREGIVFSCIADGESLNFLSTGDTYSLFANAVDNAMEAVSHLKNPEERIISLSVRKRVGMVVIAIDNYYQAADSGLVFEQGLPKTTKQNEQYHGYGMKSIQMIVKKYDGEMTIRTDEMFHLSILFPIPDWAKD